MSNQPDDKLLDENISRLLNASPDCPQLPTGAEQSMLDALAVKQTELYPAKEKTMDAIAPTLKTRETSFSFPAALLIAASIGAVVVVALWMNQDAAPSNSVGGSPAAIAKTIEAERSQRQQLEDGTIVIAREGAKYTIDAKRQLTLAQGDLYLIVAKSKQPFVVRTKDGRVTAHGTRFTVSANKKTKAAVAQGRVEMSSKAGSIQLRAGQQGTLAADTIPQRQAAPRLSYQVNWAKEHLSQQERLVEQVDVKSGLVAIDPWGQEMNLTLRKYQVDIHIEDGIARTTIDQTFFNHNPGNTEGTFYFPLPPDGSVSRLAMYVNGGLNEGGMVERGYGQEVYNDIRYQWRDPALLEMMEGNVFKMRIFPLEGRQEKRVFLSYTQTLQELYGTMRYWFPMDHTHSTANQLSIRVRIKDGAKSLSPQSSTHKLEATIEGDDLVLTYNAEDVKPDQDLLLNLLPSEKLASSRITTSQKDGHRFLFARIHPELSGTIKHQPRQWIVLNDVSASRTAIEAEAQSYIVDRLLQEADDDDSLAVIDLNTRATPKTDGFLSIQQARKTGFSLKTSAHSDRSIRLKARLLGATNIEAGLGAIASLLKNHPADNPHILYLGDGVATDGQTEIAALVRQLPGAATFVGIGVGKKVEAKFLQSAADATGGMFAVINPDEDIDWRVFDLLAALNTPRLTGLQVSLEADGRETEETIAYPNARVVSEGETLQVVARFGEDLPSQLVLRGQLNDKPWIKTFDLTDARESAQYIPRLWAKRHIDELLKSGTEFKDEVVDLSKQYYVVTPHTSLIVLEDDAMYEKYKVERGRKDHWALYQAPKKIEVVKEPIDWSRWDGWGRVWQGEDESVKAITKPQSVKDIVESVQFRVNAPFYYWKSQQSGQGRHALYQLLDSEADPTRSLTYLFATASGKTLPSTGTKDGRSGESTSGPARSGQENGQWGGNRQGLYWESGGGQGGSVGGGFAYRSQLFRSRTRSLRGEMMLPSFGTMGPYHGGRLLDNSKSMQRELGTILTSPGYIQTLEMGLSVMHGNVLGKERYLGNIPNLGDLPILGSGFRTYSLEVNKRLAPRGMLHGLPVSGLDGYYNDEIAPPVMRTYAHAIRARWSRMDRDVRRFNQQYGGAWNWSDSDWSGTTNTIDLNGTFGNGTFDAGWARDLQNTMFVSKEKESRLLQLGQLGLIVNGEMPRTFQYELERRTAPGPHMASLGRAMTTLPGVCAILAADHLVPRRAELLEATQKESDELELTELALSGTENAQARLESSGAFWSWKGWNYRPQPSTFQPPVVQAYPHYNWTFDLTRYADGLYSTQFDVLNEVAERYGQAKAAGKISDEARSRIEKARAAIRPVRIGDQEAGVDVLVASGDRYVVNGRSEMYLHERMVCDGKHVFHEYAELGLIARRKATSLRLASLRQMVPHLVQPADSMVQRFDVKLETSDDAHFTLRLTPVGQKEKDKDRYHLLVRVANDGRIDEKLLMINDRQQLKLAYQYEDKKIVVRWTDKKEKQLGEQSYLAAEVAVDEISKDTFKVDLHDQVVIDMPLRRPSYYKQKLEELDDDLTDEEVRLNRHLSLASLQQLHTRRWGQGNAESQKAIADAINLLNTSGAKSTLGDLTLLGSAGCTSTQQFDKVKLPATHPVNRYFRLRLSNWADAAKVRDEQPNTLVGHLSAYYVTTQHRKGDDSEFEKLMKQYGDSPLVLAAAWTRANWGNTPEAWIPLYEHPRWRGMAVLMSAGQLKTAEQRAKWAPAFQKWHDEYVDAGYEMAIPMQVVNQLKQYEDGKLWRKVVTGKWQRARDQKRLAPRLAFAEHAMAWGETEHAEKALRSVRKQIDKRETLLPKLALAQAYWAGGRPKDALKLYDEVLAALQQKKIAASPALLASMARLAQQAGDLGRAIDLEERALEAEHPYLPERINLQAFRQRYNWLGQQLQIKVQQATQQKDEKAVNAWLARAMTVWQLWFEIDPQNPAMIRQLATMLEDAGRSDDAWMYLSTVIDQKPKDANSYYQVGQWYLTRSNPDKAQEYYATAFTWDTANPRWLVERAKVLKQMKRHDDSRRLYQQVLEGKWASGLQGYVNQAKQALK